MSRLSLQGHAPPAGLGNPLVAAAELGGALLLACWRWRCRSWGSRWP